MSMNLTPELTAIKMLLRESVSKGKIQQESIQEVLDYLDECIENSKKANITKVGIRILITTLSEKLLNSGILSEVVEFLEEIKESLFGE
jgi:coenzyme F420-reducing hydrogenase beta subunit